MDGLQISQDWYSSPTRNTRKKMRQWQRWSDEVIPSLIQPYLKYRRLSRSLRETVVSQSPIHECQCIHRHLKIACINFDSMYLFLAYSLCSPFVRYAIHWSLGVFLCHSSTTTALIGLFSMCTPCTHSCC